MSLKRKTSGGAGGSAQPASRSQREASEAVHAKRCIDEWGFHDDPDPLTRFLRDRRLKLALEKVLNEAALKPGSASALVVCSGVGGEGTLLANAGFAVTVCDFSVNALRICQQRDPRLATVACDAEQLCFRDGSFDLVVVQDGLHHLRRPPVGLTEMLRVACRSVILIEPHAGLVGNVFGTRWEQEEGATNYVFRWTDRMLREVTSSYLLEPEVRIFPMRIWDHNLQIQRMVNSLPRRLRLPLARFTYTALRVLLQRMGNMMVAVIVRPPPSLSPSRSSNELNGTD